MGVPTPEELATKAAEQAFAAALPPAGPLFAARLADLHVCPMVDGVKPHVGGPIIIGAPTVMICGMPAARVGDAVTCVGPPDVIAKGSMTVLICGMPAARMMDMTAHGGVITLGANRDHRRLVSATKQVDQWVTWVAGVEQRAPGNRGCCGPLRSTTATLTSSTCFFAVT